MALGQELITLDDVRNYRDVDKSYSTVRFSGFLKEVQEGDLRNLLGDSMWYEAFNTDFAAPYNVLLTGEPYTYNNETVFFDGIKPFLVWAWLSKLPLEGNVHHTQSGDVSYMREVTSQPNKAALSQAKENYKKNILIERNKIIQYLDTKSDNFPLWVPKNKQNESNYQFNII